MGISAASVPRSKPNQGRLVPYRVVIIEESAILRGMMSRWLGECDEFNVVARFGTMASAKSGIGDAAAEIVVLDVEAEKLDGTELLNWLLKVDPSYQILTITALGGKKCPGLIVAGKNPVAGTLERSSVTREVTTSVKFREELVDVTSRLGKAFRQSHKGPRPAGSKVPKVNVKVAPKTIRESPPGNYTRVEASRAKPAILAVGSSTGGPKALYEVFASLKGKINVPVVITQHMPPMFTGILAEHLAKAAGTVAKEGSHGEKLVPGHIYVAPGDKHMLIAGTEQNPTIVLNEGPEENFCRPSVDPMLRSVSKIYGNRALCLILTGMGHDGCEGAREIVAAGGTVIGQDEESSVVWGMPGAVAKAGLCSQILPLGQIGPGASSLLKGIVK